MSPSPLGVGKWGGGVHLTSQVPRLYPRIWEWSSGMGMLNRLPGCFRWTFKFENCFWRPTWKLTLIKANTCDTKERKEQALQVKDCPEEMSRSENQPVDCKRSKLTLLGHQSLLKVRITLSRRDSMPLRAVLPSLRYTGWSSFCNPRVIGWGVYRTANLEFSSSMK